MSDIEEISSVGSQEDSVADDSKSQVEEDISDVESEKTEEEEVDLDKGEEISDNEQDDLSIQTEEQQTKKKNLQKKSKSNTIEYDKKDIETIFVAEEEENDDETDVSEDEEYYKKFENNVNKDHIIQTHHHIKEINYDEINALTKVVRDANGNIVDPLHKTIPVLTRFERAKIIGQRATQINNGAQPFIHVRDDIIDGLVIAEMELKEKVIPFIIVRPLPNGKKEYWKLGDLENIDY